MITKIINNLWGNLSNEELKRFGLLSVIITIILGNYWMLRVMKNPIFNDLVGMEYQPYAKMGSIFVAVFVVLIYSKLVDYFSKKILFDIICIFFSALFFFICFAIGEYKTFFSDMNNTHLIKILNIQGNIIGWLAYFIFETSSILIVLFWSFVASTTKPDAARKGYAMIVSCTQLGTISGPAIVTNYAQTVGLPMLIGLGGFLVILVPFLFRLYLAVVEKDYVQESNVPDGKKPKTGFFEGVKLVATKPYVMGLLIVSTACEVIATIIEFQMNMMAKDVFSSRELFASFTGKYGVSINTMALMFSFFGTSYFMRKYGIRFCLLAYPITIGIILCGLLILYNINLSNIEMMWILFMGMIIIRGLGYALNNPTKEVIYIPTTKDTRFKAKGFIESFGVRAAKAGGSAINAAFVKNLPELLLFGTLISLGVVGSWIIVANLLGKKFNNLQAEMRIFQQKKLK